MLSLPVYKKRRNQVNREIIICETIDISDDMCYTRQALSATEIFFSGEALHPPRQTKSTTPVLSVTSSIFTWESVLSSSRTEGRELEDLCRSSVIADESIFRRKSTIVSIVKSSSCPALNFSTTVVHSERSITFCTRPGSIPFIHSLQTQSQSKGSLV